MNCITFWKSNLSTLSRFCLKLSLSVLLIFFLIACKGNKEKDPENILPEGPPETERAGKQVSIEYAKGFEITDYKGFKIIKVHDPWPNAEKDFTYLLAKNGAEIPNGLEYDEKITVPIDEIAVTSTTHIPALEALGEINSLVGFPGLDYISSEKARDRIEAGKVRELGSNQNLNTEILLELNPDVVVGFAVSGANKALNAIEKSEIPVVYNGDWMEKNPLGKAEWIKFFGAFYGKSSEATSIFEQIEKDYLEAKKLAKSVDEKPVVLAGSMFKDQWYVPYGNSWQANFIADAGGIYVYGETRGDGSMSISFEKVFSDASDVDIWIAPGSFTSYKGLLESSEHYKKFKAFQNREIYTYAKTRGETGGVLYYELAPARPDLVLKDLMKIFHPELLPEYETVFFKELD